MTAAEHWHRRIVVEGQKVIEADPRIVDAFKNIGYSLEAAVADLVDNSLDARATIVLIRFLRTHDEILSLVVVDNGRGMRAGEIDRAMQFGGRRTYAEGDLGMYGMGLKSASLSQADSVTVLSRSHKHDPVGRRWTEAQAKAGWKCDIVSQAFAAEELDRPWAAGLRLRPSGTVVRWDHVRDFQKASGRVDTYLRRVRIAIANHLGLQLHRFLSSGGLRIWIDTENVDTGEVGIQTPVTPLDPFAYERSGSRGYPKKFRVTIPDAGDLGATAHVWPARSKLPGYKLGGGAVSRRQGFYFYRNDRLIQAGGWNNLRDDAEPHVSLAHVVVDLPAELETFFSVRFSKSGIDAPRSFVDALETATADDGTRFGQFVDRAIDVYRTRGEAKLKPVVPPGVGIRAEVQRAVRDNLPVIPRDENVEVRWESLPPDRFFHIDRHDRVLVLNKRYRKAVLGNRRASRADAPLTKVLVYLLLNDMFRTQRESAIERRTLHRVPSDLRLRRQMRPAVMERESRHLSWERFEQLVEAGPPAVEVVAGDPRVEIFTDAGGSRIGVRTPAGESEPPPSPLVEIDIRQQRVGGGDFVEVSTANTTLYRDFYAFACAVADRVQVEGMPAGAAVDSAIEAWAALLERLVVLNDERQVGLIGELWLLRRLSDVSGWTTAVEAWKGSDAEEHDFSWPGADVEVKTTLSEGRVHVIGSLTQLVPTGSTPLFVLSLQLTGAGAGPGSSLTETVHDVHERMAGESEVTRRRLRGLLDDAGWRTEHAPHYRRRFVLRTAPTMVPVDDQCPAITPAILAVLGPARVARLGQVAYRVDLTGLGHEDGSPEFDAVLPTRGAS